MPSIRLPNGKVVRNVPEGITKEQFQNNAIKAGWATPEDFGLSPAATGGNVDPLTTQATPAALTNGSTIPPLSSPGEQQPFLPPSQPVASMSQPRPIQGVEEAPEQFQARVNEWQQPTQPMGQQPVAPQQPQLPTQQPKPTMQQRVQQFIADAQEVKTGMAESVNQPGFFTESVPDFWSKFSEGLSGKRLAAGFTADLLNTVGNKLRSNVEQNKKRYADQLRAGMITQQEYDRVIELLDQESAQNESMMKSFDLAPEDTAKVREFINKEEEEATPKGLSLVQRGMRSGAVSSMMNAPSTFAAVLGQTPLATAMFALPTYTSSYADAIEEGLDPDTANEYASLQTMVEVGTEANPIQKLKKIGGVFKGKKKEIETLKDKAFDDTLGKDVKDFMLSELGGEQVAFFGQTAIDIKYGMGIGKKWAGMTPEQRFKYLAEGAGESLVATLFAGGGQATLAAGVRRVFGDVDTGKAEKDIAKAIEDMPLQDTAARDYTQPKVIEQEAAQATQDADITEAMGQGEKVAPESPQPQMGSDTQSPFAQKMQTLDTKAYDDEKSGDEMAAAVATPQDSTLSTTEKPTEKPSVEVAPVTSKEVEKPQAPAEKSTVIPKAKPEVSKKPADVLNQQLPEILTAKKSAIVNKMMKDQGIKKGSPGFAEAKARIESEYEAELDKTLAQQPFEVFNAYNADVPESINRQAYDNLREDLGITETVSAKSEEITEQPAEKIEDFGEKIKGAKKDAWSGYKDSLEDKEVDVEGVPLSKSFPKPDYAKMESEGVDKSALAALALIRSEIPSKPRKGWRLKQWGNQVSSLRELAQKIVSGEYDAEMIRKKMRDNSSLQPIADMIPVIAQLPADKIDEAAGWRIKEGQFKIFRGKEYSPPKTLYFAIPKGKSFPPDTSLEGESLADVQKSLVKYLSEGKGVEKKAKPKYKMSVYMDRKTKEFFVGWKGAGGVVRVEDGFKTAKEARSKLENERQQLEDKLTKMKETPEVRRAENRAREGKKRRDGNVTPEQFQKRFGFFGVQFGNWVENKKRQQDLNDAYEALLDLSELVDVSPEALSLNGSLGVAFGARGSGGKNPAKAHYEAGDIVINLTKKAGAGSLAHEWFHALDNYFGKMEERAETSGRSNRKPSSKFLTDTKSVERKYHGAKKGVRDEVYDAFQNLQKVVNKSEYKKRAEDADALRSTPYWATTVELTARAFEKYLVKKMESQKESNDYLANLQQESGMYPTDKELKDDGIAAAFDTLFDVMQEQATDDGVALFNREQAERIPESKPEKPVERKDAQQAIDDFLKEYKGVKNIPVRVFDNATEAYGQKIVDKEQLKPGDVSGSFWRGGIQIIRDGNATKDDVTRTLRHEAWVHYGLSLMNPEQKAAFLKRIKGLIAESRELTKIAEGVRKDYTRRDGSFSLKDDVFYEEVAAKIAEKYGDEINDIVTGKIKKPTAFQTQLKKFYDVIVSALRQLGLLDKSVSREAQVQEAIDLVLDRAAALRGVDSKNLRQGKTKGSPLFMVKDGDAKAEEAAPAFARKAKKKPATMYDGFDSKQVKVLREAIAKHPDGKLLRERLMQYKGSPWAKQALNGLLVREAIDRLIAGKPVTFNNALTHANKKLADKIAENGAEAVFDRLADPDIGTLGWTTKAGWVVNSSYANCDPTKECAWECYAATGRNFSNNIIKSELVSFAADTNPKRLGEMIAADYKRTPEGRIGSKALRLFDKGDADYSGNWARVVDAINKKGVRVQVFSKRPDFLRGISDFNLRLLSIDQTNLDAAKNNPDLKLAYTLNTVNNYTLDFLESVREQIQVILPIKLGVKKMDKKQIAKLPKWANKYTCPIDKGVKQIGDWACTDCDKKAGLGCFYGQVTDRLKKVVKDPNFELDEKFKEIVNAAEKASPEVRERILGQLDQIISEVWVATEQTRERETVGRTDSKDGKESQAGVIATDSDSPTFSRKGLKPFTEDSDFVNDPFLIKDADSFEKAVTYFVDKFERVRRVQKQIKEQGGEVASDADTYLSEELYHGKVGNDLDIFDKEIVEKLRDKMRKMGVSRELLDLYLIVRHAPERNRYVKSIRPDMESGSGVSTKEANATRAMLEESEYGSKLKELAADVDKIIRMRNELKVNAGLETRADQSKYPDWKHYVPMKGMAYDEKKGRMSGGGGGLNVQGKEDKVLKGRFSPPDSPLAYVIADMTETIIRARKAEVGNTFLNLVRDNPNPNLWEIFTEAKPDTTTVRVAENGKPVVKKKRMTAAEMKGATRNGMPVYFVTKRNGKEYFIKVKDDRLMDAMRNLGTEDMGVFLQAMAAGTRYLSTMLTSFSPEFVVSNFIRDLQTAIYNITGEQTGKEGKLLGQKIAMQTIKDIGRAVSGIASEEFSTKASEQKEWSKFYREFKEAGAKTGWFDQKSPEQLKKAIDKKLNRGKVADAFSGLLDSVDAVNTSVENAVRLATYVNARKAFEPLVQTGQMTDRESKDRAASLAKNLTVNFNRKGQAGSNLNALYMFANAAIQGNYQFYRTLFMRHPAGGANLTMSQKLAAGSVLVGFFLTLINEAISPDDDDGESYYSKIPDYVKERNFIIMDHTDDDKKSPQREDYETDAEFKEAYDEFIEGRYTKLPMPYGYNVFTDVGVAVAEMYLGQKTNNEASSFLTTAVLGSFLPIGFPERDSTIESIRSGLVPTLAKPAAELMENRNFFNSPIMQEPFPNDTTPRSQLSKRTTGELWKWTAETLNTVSGGDETVSGAMDYSPDAFEHIWEFVSGGLGKTVNRTMKSVETAAKGEPVATNDIPFLRTVRGEPSKWRHSQYYFENKKLPLQRLEGYERLVEEGMDKEAEIYNETYGEYIILGQISDTIEKNLKKMRKALRRAEADDDKARIADIKQEMDKQYMRFNTAHRKLIRDGMSEDYMKEVDK